MEPVRGYHFSNFRESREAGARETQEGWLERPALHVGRKRKGWRGWSGGRVEKERAHVQNRHVGHPAGAKMSARRHLKYYLKVYSIDNKHSNGFADVLKRKRLAFGILMGGFPK
jgi:hypothetical protein